MIEESANDYSSYFKIDVTKEFGPVVETIEDMLTRLEEFESLVDMVQSNGSECLGNIVPEILAQKDGLQSLCQRIDSLETFVSRVHHDLDIVETQMDVAESDVGSSEGTLRNILKPLFFGTVPCVLRRSLDCARERLLIQ
ncbi:biogenesis of lysosome-related organelles complex 1 subunit 4 isoform X2 [Anabrus simplex]|uniref:biogenesis of lysosome-related organelles complex 1 subunit 4 isoform X2 n=1 Tax=Anabrus simplex TaxID=316456 RepID=UPI0034DCE3F7